MAVAVVVVVARITFAVVIQIVLIRVGIDRAIVGVVGDAIGVVVRVAGITKAVQVNVRLVRVGGERAVVDAIERAVFVGVTVGRRAPWRPWSAPQQLAAVVQVDVSVPVRIGHDRGAPRADRGPDAVPGVGFESPSPSRPRPTGPHMALISC